MKVKAWPFLLVLLFLFPEITEEKRDAFRGLASSWTMIPSRSLAGLHYLFQGYEIRPETGLVSVTGPVIEIINGETLGSKVFRQGYISEIDLEDFEEEQSLGQSIFEAKTGAGTNVGTAFLVGNDLVMTNRHIMGIRPTDKVRPCGKFSIKLNHKEESVSCRRVEFCSRRFDYCVVKMNSMLNGLTLGDEIKPLRLERKVRPDKDLRLLHIGNAAGLGIQASSGRGISIQSGEFFHYVPTLGGSSGAPIFNDKNAVIGINWGHTGVSYFDEAAFNRGILMQTIFDEMKVHAPRTLNQIKSFRSWLHRTLTHRQVKIRPTPESRP